MRRILDTVILLLGLLAAVGLLALVVRIVVALVVGFFRGGWF